MAYRKKKNSASFVMIPREMMRSEAWTNLKHYSVRAYLHIRYKFNGKNGDNLSFTYDEASKIMNGHTYSKAIGQLVDLGFLDMKRSGAFYGKCNIFGLSDRWQKYGTSDFRQGKRIAIKQNPFELGK